MDGAAPASTSLAELSQPLLALARRTASELYPAFGPYADTLINGLTALVLIGQALLVVLLVTFVMSHSIGRRNPTLLNVIVVSILTGIPGLLLVYTGNAFVKTVSPILCLTQAALKNGADTMFVMAPLALVIELYCSTKTSTQRSIAFRRVALVALPYVTFFGFSLMTTVIGIEFPQTVFHDVNDAYCEVHSAGLQVGVGAFGGVVVTATIAFNILTALSLRRSWSTAQRSKESTAVTMSILYRLAGYTVVQITYLILDTLTLAENSTIIILQDLYQASMPLLVFLVYGLSGDIIRIWFCMGPRPGSQLHSQDGASSGTRPWTMVGSLRQSVASDDTAKTLAPPDLEKGKGTPRGSLDKGRAAHVRGGSDAGSQYSWDPNWERASATRFGTPPSGGDLPAPPPPLPRMPEILVHSPRESRTPVDGKSWGQSF